MQEHKARIWIQKHKALHYTNMPDSAVSEKGNFLEDVQVLTVTWGSG